NADIALGIVADAREALRALLAALPDQPGPRRDERRREARRDREEFEAITTPPGVREGGLVDPTGVVADLMRLLPPEAIITGDAGNFWHWFARYYRFRPPARFLGPPSGAMGYAAPAAVGAALRRRGTPVGPVADAGGFGR